MAHGSREVEKIRRGQRNKWQEGGYSDDEYSTKQKAKTNKPKRGNERDEELDEE